jgi:hypothetical protein
MNVAVGGTNGWFPDGQGDKPWLNHAGSKSSLLRLLAVFGALTCGMHTDPMVNFIKNKAQWLPTWLEDPKERGLGV